MKTIHLFPFLLLSFIAKAQPCPKYGNATANNPDERRLNTEKNKSAAIPHSAAQPIQLNTLITTVNKPDKKKFQEGAYVSVEGFITDFGEQGGESCNCGKASKTAKTGDVHIYVGLTPDAVKKNCIVVEITPAFKKLHPDYAGMVKKKEKVRVSGYLIARTGIYEHMH